MQKWDVYIVNQSQSRSDTNPSQPSDPIRPQRLYVIISPNIHLKSSAQATCLPIGEKYRGAMSVELSNGIGGTKKNSYVWCNEIYTFPKNFFITQTGSLLMNQNIIDKIKISLKDYLELH